MSPMNRKFGINYAKVPLTDRPLVCLYWV